jgi:hypothetical protein
MITGVLLTVLGVGFYLATDRVSVTALIPAFFGVPLFLLGLLARQEKYLKHAMHAAAALGLIGLVAVLVRLVPALIESGADFSKPALVSQALMALLCAVFVALCIRSFIVARRNRARSQEG